MKKRIFALVLVLALCLGGGLSLPARAMDGESRYAAEEFTAIAEPPIVLRLAYANSVETKLAFSSQTAKITCRVIGYIGVTTKIEITATLEKKVLLWWSDVQTWSAAYNGYQGTLSPQLTVASGKYRVKAVYKIYSGSKYETVTDYSAELSC